MVAHYTEHTALCITKRHYPAYYMSISQTNKHMKHCFE